MLGIEDMEKWLEFLVKWGVPEEKAKKRLLQNVLRISDREATGLFDPSPPTPSESPQSQIGCQNP